jgi:hypothetical protein
MFVEVLSDAKALLMGDNPAEAGSARIAPRPPKLDDSDERRIHLITASGQKSRNGHINAILCEF